MQSITDILKTIDDAINTFQDKMPGLQKQLFDELQPLLKEIEIKNGKLLNNVKNLKLLGQLKNKLRKIIINPQYKDAVNKFIDSYNTLSALNMDYFKQFNQKFTPSKTLPFIKELAVESTINDLVGQGLNVNIVNAVTEILNKNITTGGSYASLQNQLRDHILNNDTGDGSLVKYTKQITTDAINQYHAQYHAAIAQDLQFNWGRYVGSLLTTSREFCVLLTKKEWVHKSELPEIIKGHIDGKSCQLSKSTGLPLGMIPGTDANNFKINRGGYQCGHHYFEVPDSAVPDNVKTQFNNPTKEPDIDYKKHIAIIKKDEFYDSELAYFNRKLGEWKNDKQALLEDGYDFSGIDKYNLTEDEASVIFGYSALSYRKLNRQLYGKEAISNETKSFELLLNNSLDKMPKYKGDVIRFFSDDNSKQILAGYKKNIGGDVNFDGFISSSKREDFDWGGDIIYHIKSINGRSINTISAHAGEDEILFKSGSGFKILKVEEGDVYLEEID